MRQVIFIFLAVVILSVIFLLNIGSSVKCNEPSSLSSSSSSSPSSSSSKLTSKDNIIIAADELFEQFSSNIQNSLTLPIKKLVNLISKSNNIKFEKIERIIKKVLPNYLVQSYSPEQESDHLFLDNFHIETNYQFQKSTDEYSAFDIMTKQEQNLILFILGTATRTFTDIFGNNFISQPENAYLKNLIEFSDQENYEHDLIRLKVKLFFKEVERNIKEGNSKEKIGWLFKKSYKRFNDDLFEFDSQLFTTTYPLGDCSNIRGILFVGGLYTDWYPFYFDGLKEYLKNCKADFKISQVDTGKGVESNAEFLKNEIIEYFNELNNITTSRVNENNENNNEQQQQQHSTINTNNNSNNNNNDNNNDNNNNMINSEEKETSSEMNQKLLVIGHSKGACDITYALAKYENELKPYVKGLISLQAPYAGSALANDITEFGAAKILLLKILIEDVLGGELKAIEDMSYNERMKQVTQYPYPSSTFPCIAMSSYENSPNSLLYPAISYLKARYNVTNDGLVPTMDGYIPGCKNIIIKDMDHSGSAFTGFPNLSKYDPAQLSLTFIHMWNHYFTKND
ncbi:predicted protein [Naegleria gruberi]|uniref:Predicted protein n=1 Tax=Naegleria gruberi TaxID=5762 RepID=D2VTA4_NAEGR|nr:uncharacterized protein NAEGRDRAFT_72230 [Naegleria gruberi]EFC39824.1 predicted protein [Naegleria gruberi]|eukprot:XP_002672568.1 predicted protein [Naegleria gruberi strain NEG-M]